MTRFTFSIAQLAPLLAAMLLAVAAPSRTQAQKTDTLTLVNGDRIIGEIKAVSRGKLDYSTDDAGRLSIEWIKVARLTSARTFDIADQFGKRHFGPLLPSVQAGLLTVGANPPDTLRIVDVVEITELGGHLAQRINGMADVGFTYTKANKASTFSTRGEIEYRGPLIGATVNLDSYVQNQEAADLISRQSANFGASWFLKDQWSVEGAFTLERNDELNLARRLFGGGGVGRAIHESNHDNVQLVGGVVVTTERFTVDSAADNSSTNLEGALRFKAETFRFDKPKLRVTADINLFPSISTLGRVRGDSSFETQFEGIRDLSLGIRFRNTFDSRPPTDDAQKHDYSLTFTVGWSYRR